MQVKRETLIGGGKSDMSHDVLSIDATTILLVTVETTFLH